MTNEELKEIIRVCGPNFEETDIPAYIRQREEQAIKDELLVEELEREEYLREN